MGEITFSDYPQFKPNLTPREIFTRGAFGGTYFRPIRSGITGKTYKDVYKKYPNSFWKDIDVRMLTTSWDKYDKNINKYKVKVGSTLEFWEEKDWIVAQDPYGWVQWYIEFYYGRRSEDDQRQIKRWLQTAGPRSRFRVRLTNMVRDAKTHISDRSISPKIRQTLLHWGVDLS
jgi:hypothetical protein